MLRELEVRFNGDVLHDHFDLFLDWYLNLTDNE